MSFGLKTAPATFQRAMEIVLAGLTFESCLCYLDDVICFGRTLSEHNNRLAAILRRFREHNLRVKLSKCQFAATEVSFLGHKISKNGISPDPNKVAAVKQIPVPTCIKDVRSFLGLAGYYRRFIPDFSTVAAPLNQLTTKEESKKPFSWSRECEQSFQKLKNSLCSAPVLAYPRFDRPFTLYTDASDYGLGAVLSQHDENGIERVIAYGSQALSNRERNYATTEKEALAIHYGTKHFRIYLLGKEFKIVTDHNALCWLHNMEPKGRIGRWLMDLQEFQFTVEHRAGKMHANADALSRLMAEVSDKDGSNRTASISAGPDVEQKHTTCATTVNPTINLLDAQRQDQFISKVIDCKFKKEEKPAFSEWKNNPTLRNFWFNFDRLFIHNNLLVRSRNVKSTHPDHAIVVPQSLVPDILKGLHDNPFCGHLGVTRTEERIRERFYWPGIRSSVTEYIRQCQTCQQRKSAASSNKAPMQTIEVGKPFTFWAIDYMGPIRETARGNKHILVLIDHFTKWCEAFPTKDQKASTVARILVNKVFSRFGPPVVLHSDQGSNFESHLMHEICDIMGVTKTRTTAYHPSGDGQVERQNRTLQDMIAAFVSKNRDDWDLWLDPVVYAYNTSRQESTGFSPYQLVFGKQPRMPLETELGIPINNPGTQSEYARTVRSVLRDTTQLAKERLEAVRAKRSSQYSNPHWIPFKPGQLVWLKRPAGWKFGQKWTGPYRILSRMGVNYSLRSQTGRELVVHHDHLKLCHVPIDRGRIVCPGRESDDFQLVHVSPQPANVPQTGNRVAPRPRPARFRQVVCPPSRYGFNSDSQ